MTIILYDHASSTTGYLASPMTWRIRYCRLGIKQLAYQIEWVEYPDIEALYKKLGVTPTAKKADDTGPHYTVPLIYEPSTNKYIADSYDIAEYLGQQYPDTPADFPGNTAGLHLAFTDGLWSQVGPARMILTWNIFKSLNLRSQVMYRQAREPGLRKKRVELVPAGSEDAEISKLKVVLRKLETYYMKTSGTGPFLMGETPPWSDIVIASFLVPLRVSWGKNSQQWKDALDYPNGRCAVFMESMKKYERR